MKTFIDYIKAQDKVKLLIYLFSFSFYVLVNNGIYNLVTYTFYDKVFFNDIKWGFASMCFPEQRLNALPFCLIIKILLFQGMWFLSDTAVKKYAKEILILYFLFDIGQVSAVFIFPLLHSFLPNNFSDFNFYFYSDFELLSTDIGDSWYSPIFIAAFWSFSIVFYLKKEQKLKLEYILKRFLIMPLTVVIYALLKYYLYYKLFVLN